MNDSQKLDLILSKLNDMDTRLEGIDTRLDGIDTKIENLDLEVRAIKLNIENEIDRNIKTMTDWYLNLSQKSSETIQIASDIKAKQDMHDILNVYTSKLRAL